MSDANMKWVLNWMERMMEKTGLCGCVWPEVLAAYCNETGNETPSDMAVITAKKWESDLTDFVQFVRQSHGWCNNPSWGCIHLCKFWKHKKLEKLLK